MTRHWMTFLAALFAAAGAGLAQEGTKGPPPEQKKAEAKKAEEKKAAPKKIEVLRFRVSLEGGGERPPNLRVEISGQETACGPLAGNDRSSAVDEHGEAVFRDVPVCKITVKINANRFLPLRATVDLAAYRAPIALTLQPEK